MTKKLFPFTHDDYEILNKETVYSGVYKMMQYEFRHRLFEGGLSEAYRREVLVRRPAVAVLPYDPIRDEVVLVQQFRVGALAYHSEPWLIEIIAGVIDTDEKPEAVALREAKEEANCTVEILHPILNYFSSPGGSNEMISLFCAKTSTENMGGVFGLKEENENIRALVFPAKEAFQLVADGTIKASPAVIALLWLELHRANLRKIW